MELKFLGRGAAFNPKEGNNSAYFIEGRELFLIDCGEMVFEKLICDNILDNIDTINVMITHTHGDHIGSLGTLILYCFYNSRKVNIIMKDGAKHIGSIDSILKCMGCYRDRYNYIFEDTLDGKYLSFNSIRYTETIHSDNLDCYSLIFETDDGIIYYSGDTRELDTLRSLLDKKIDKIFIDVSSRSYEGNSHVYIGDLDKIIPDNLRDRVYCMHLSDDRCINMALEYGFNIVKKSEN